MSAGRNITPFRAPDRELEDRILDAVDRLLACHGYEGLELEAVAGEAGLTKSKLYLHFQNRQDLILGHADRIARGILMSGAAIATQSDLPWPDKIRELLFHRVMAHFDAVQHFAESLGEIMRDVGPSLLARRDDAMQREAEVLGWLLEEGEEPGAFRPQDSRATALALLTLTNALLPYSANPAQFLQRRQLEENLHRMIDLLIDGIATSGRVQISRLPAFRTLTAVR